MKKFFKVVFLIALVLVGVLFGIRVYQQWQVKILSETVYELPENYEDLPIANIIVDYVFDPNDLNAHAGFVDYIFVGRVEEVTGVTYTDVRLFYHDFPIAKIDAFPETGYKVTVLENIKGVLQKDITIKQGSGPSVNGKQMELVTGEIMKENDVRIFLMNTDTDGELYVSSNLGAVMLGNLSDTEDYSEFIKDEDVKKTIEKYSDAFENQDESYKFGESVLSIYDITA
ncbi:MAG: hypothetical protein IKB12_00900 [Clostridia bacterium]|nr:hypothetical protein [Clostridia bacterium]